MHKWWRYPDRIIIAVATSLEDLPIPSYAVDHMWMRSEDGVFISQSTTPTMSMCRFIPNASEEQVADQQNDMLRLLCAPVVWAAYWGDSEDSDRIWTQGGGGLLELYTHLRSEVEYKTKIADGKPTNAVVGLGPFTYSDGYRTVKIRGETHRLTSQQAQMIGILHEAHKNGNPDVPIARIQELLGKRSSRWQDTWKSNKKARVALIQGGERKGTLHLNL